MQKVNVRFFVGAINDGVYAWRPSGSSGRFGGSAVLKAYGPIPRGFRDNRTQSRSLVHSLQFRIVDHPLNNLQQLCRREWFLKVRTVGDSLELVRTRLPGNK